MTKNLTIFEGAMCCSTGLCSPEPDQELIQLNEDLKTLKAEFPEDSIARVSMSFNPGAFLEQPEVLKEVNEKGVVILPITAIDGKIIARQKYMTYDEMKAALLRAE